MKKYVFLLLIPAISHAFQEACESTKTIYISSYEMFETNYSLPLVTKMYDSQYEGGDAGLTVIHDILNLSYYDYTLGFPKTIGASLLYEYCVNHIQVEPELQEPAKPSIDISNPLKPSFLSVTKLFNLFG